MGELCTMKVVFSTYESPGLSGNFRRAIQMAEGLAQNDCHVFLLTSASKFQLFPKKYQVGLVTIIESAGFFPFKYRFSGFDPYDLLIRSVLCVWLRADSYHSFNPKPVSIFPCLLAAKILRRPWFFDWADLWGPGGIYEIKKQYTSLFTRISMVIETWLEKLATSKADICTCISQKMVEVCKQRGGKPLYVTVGTAPDLAAMETSAARKKLGFPLTKKIVGFVYTDSPDSIMLKKAIRLLEKHEIQFIIMGPQLFEKRKPSNVIYNSFTNRAELAPYLSACNICLVPFSDLPINEYRYPNKIGDYLACHKPFLTNPVGDMTSLIAKERIGWLAQGSAERLATEILKILSNTKDVAQKTKAAQEYAKKQTWKLLTKQLKAAYLSPTSSKVPART